MERSDASSRVARGAPEAQVTEREPSAEERAALVGRWGPWLEGRRLLDVGCGEGHNLETFSSAGFEIEGVELNAQLAARSRLRGHTVHEADAVSFVREQGARFQGFLLLDFIEHVLPEQADALLRAVPSGALAIVQTPNTFSIAGHQFYLQVPSHVAPYSPPVLARMLERAGFDTISTGTLYGGLPWRGLRRRFTEWLLVKLVGTVTARLLNEGANYYVVARRR